MKMPERRGMSWYGLWMGELTSGPRDAVSALWMEPPQCFGIYAYGPDPVSGAENGVEGPSAKSLTDMKDMDGIE